MVTSNSRIDESIRKLQPCLKRFVRDAEALFGPRNERWDFPLIRARKDGGNGPYTDTSKCPHLTVLLPECSLMRDDLTEAEWHVAHESVHVLDPHANPTNYLEEGLATWFQNCKVKQYNGPRWDPWVEAENRVKPWTDVLPERLKRFRAKQRELRLQGQRWIRLGDITDDVLSVYCREVNEQAKSLVCRFPKCPKPAVV